MRSFLKVLACLFIFSFLTAVVAALVGLPIAGLWFIVSTASFWGSLFKIAMIGLIGGFVIGLVFVGEEYELCEIDFVGYIPILRIRWRTVAHLAGKHE